MNAKDDENESGKQPESQKDSQRKIETLLSSIQKKPNTKQTNISPLPLENPEEEGEKNPSGSEDEPSEVSQEEEKKGMGNSAEPSKEKKVSSQKMSNPSFGEKNGSFQESGKSGNDLNASKKSLKKN